MLHFTNLVLVLKTLRLGAPRAGFFFCSVETRLGHDPTVLGCNPSCANNLYDLEKMNLLPWVLVFLYAEFQDRIPSTLLSVMMAREKRNDGAFHGKPQDLNKCKVYGMHLCLICSLALIMYKCVYKHTLTAWKEICKNASCAFLRARRLWVI